MKKVVLLGMLCAGAHDVFGMEKKRERDESCQEDTGTKKAHTDEREQVRMLVFKSLEDAAESIDFLVIKIGENLKRDWQRNDLASLALENIAHNVHEEEWRKFLVSKLGWSDLHIAAATGRVEMIASLLDRGAKIEAQDKLCSTPLHVAVVRGQIGAIGFLLDRGAQIEAQDKYRRTPLHVASYIGHLELIGCLLDRGARIEAQDTDGMTPLHWASENGQIEAIGFLLDREAEIEARNKTGCTSLHMAAATGQVEAIGFLLDRGAVIEARNKTGCTSLHAAAARGQVEAIGFLLDRGAVIEARANDGETPLMVLARENHYNCVRELISHVCLMPAPESRELLTKTRYEMTQCMSIWKKYLKGRMPKELLLRILSSVKDAEGRDVFLPLVREVFRQRGYGDIPLVLRELLAEHLTGYTLENLPRVMEEAREKARSDEMRALLDPHSVLMYGEALLSTMRKRCGVTLSK